MSRGALFGLGIAYGVGVGVALRGLLDFLEALANKPRPAVKPVRVELDGAAIERAINQHRRRKGLRSLS